jgi:hypothetical protein
MAAFAPHLGGEGPIYGILSGPWATEFTTMCAS